MLTFVTFFEVYRKRAYSMYPGEKCKQDVDKLQSLQFRGIKIIIVMILMDVGLRIVMKIVYIMSWD